VLLQAERVEQRRKLNVELAKPDNLSEHRSTYECLLFTSDIECEWILAGAGIVIIMVSIVVGDAIRRVLKDNGVSRADPLSFYRFCERGRPIVSSHISTRKPRCEP
jgi:hypothetical protein